MKRPLANFLSLLTGDLGSRVLGFFISVYLARVLEPNGFGIISIGLAVLGYLQLAGSPGIQVLETRNVAAVTEVDRARVNAVLSMRLTLAAILWVLTALVVWMAVSESETRDVVLLFGLSLFPLALNVDWFFQGKEEFLAVSSSRIVQYVSYAAMVFFFVRGQTDARSTAVAFGLGVSTAVVVLWIWYMRKWGPPRLRWSPGIWKVILKDGIPVGAAMFLAQSVTNFPPLVIGYFAGAGEVGMFASAMKLVFLMMIVDRILNALFLPAATRYFSFERDDFPRLAETTLRVVLLAVIPIALCGIILSKELVTFVFGTGYIGGTPLLRILLVFFVLTVVNSVFVCVLIASGNEGRYTRVVTMGSMVLCGATLTGAATYGAAGTAWGVVLGELVTTFLMGKEALKIARLPLGSLFIRPFLAAVCAGAVAVVLNEVDAFVLALVAVFVYVCLTIALKGITLKEIRFLRERFV